MAEDQVKDAPFIVRAAERLINAIAALPYLKVYENKKGDVVRKVNPHVIIRDPAVKGWLWDHREGLQADKFLNTTLLPESIGSMCVPLSEVDCTCPASSVIRHIAQMYALQQSMKQRLSGKPETATVEATPKDDRLVKDAESMQRALDVAAAFLKPNGESESDTTPEPSATSPTSSPAKGASGRRGRAKQSKA